jgi:protein TonB
MRGAGRLVSSLLVHLVFLGALSVIVGRPTPSPSQTSPPKEMIPLVWTPSPGGGSPKGSGGEESTAPPQRARLVGRDPISVPAASRPQLQPAKIADTRPPQPEIPAVPVASGVQDLVGTITEVSTDASLTRGPGIGDGAGGKNGSGIGERDGNRIGSGDRGAGDEFAPGNGVSWPRLVQETKPNYTSDAMRAQVRGVVLLEIVVLADGSVGRVNVVRSLDSRFGLDEEAVRAVRRWRFDPGRRLGKAVATRVGVELSFQLR